MQVMHALVGCQKRWMTSHTRLFHPVDIGATPNGSMVGMILVIHDSTGVACTSVAAAPESFQHNRRADLKGV
jgi:hypothetical protein